MVSKWESYFESKENNAMPMKSGKRQTFLQGVEIQDGDQELPSSGRVRARIQVQCRGLEPGHDQQGADHLTDNLFR